MAGWSLFLLTFQTEVDGQHWLSNPGLWLTICMSYRDRYLWDIDSIDRTWRQFHEKNLWNKQRNVNLQCDGTPRLPQCFPQMSIFSTPCRPMVEVEKAWRMQNSPCTVSLKAELQNTGKPVSKVLSKFAAQPHFVVTANWSLSFIFGEILYFLKSSETWHMRKTVDSFTGYQLILFPYGLAHLVKRDNIVLDQTYFGRCGSWLWTVRAYCGTSGPSRFIWHLLLAT